MPRISPPFSFAVFFLALLFLVPLVGLNAYYLYICSITLIYIILTVGLNIVMGFAGQLVLANAAIFGIGAYGVGLLEKHFGLPYWLSLPAGAIAATLIGLILVLPALRLSGIYLALATLSFAQCALWVMIHWTPVTFGAGGFTIDPPDFSAFGLSSEVGMFYLAWALCAAMILVARNVIQSRIGRTFVALRDHEISAQSLGIDVLKYKALAFGISSFYAGIAGALFAGTLHFIGPESFDLQQMILQLVAVVLGGVASLAGSIIGGVLIVLVLEISKDLKFSIEIIFGALLLLIVLFAPGGIAERLRRVFPSWKEKLHVDDEGLSPPIAVKAEATL
ncbi:branched-chain amino acid ABC transporter permease [Rhizobium sp. VS19-DR104.2]|uniref:branched-chain amino acid ABC transporter permease n=1 Tax=unclassified Rhizobium TaxID=2613769 RepID=UPI001CC34805|nr:MULTISPECIES: branched-chain amino acid ABC transporter permease [unclassified Rhizobium]MBZ5762230.1 branched-chain amino acid ABC transporter permease [Rhizobium sp. VS19-DR96]MBZ5768246.1 branched-chain amino acid ABC transporter permease [Rhizobium sp. VS19-DR129.2]MBZ5775882.1 branched-chain amino acid ABC transporter permease [Rhizobium sp. VS19-DRK62.2]MBZ5787097.1 branched-chain amino acid ABC transporter permease [Rhizobium sp. VS19-DR121]MBZ5804171.1 branched-chain amino acid ABC 